MTPRLVLARRDNRRSTTSPAAQANGPHHYAHVHALGPLAGTAYTHDGGGGAAGVLTRCNKLGSHRCVPSGHRYYAARNFKESHMSTKKVEVKPEVPQPPLDMSTLMTMLTILLATQRIESHREGREELNPQYGNVDPATAARIASKEQKLDAAELAVKVSRQEVREAIARAESAEVDLRDVKEISNFPDFQI